MSFPQFALLPPEIRLHIFTLALPGPRTIQISTLSANQALRATCPNLSLSPSFWFSDPNQEIRSLLLACRVSYNLVKNNYKLRFHHRLLEPIWFNPDWDTLYFTQITEISFFLAPQAFPSYLRVNTKDIESIKNLIVPHPIAFQSENKAAMEKDLVGKIVRRMIDSLPGLDILGMIADGEMTRVEVSKFFKTIGDGKWWEWIESDVHKFGNVKFGGFNSSFGRIWDEQLNCWRVVSLGD